MCAEIVRHPVSPFDLIQYRAGNLRCRIPGCQCESGLASAVTERHPLIQRVPVTQEHAVAVIVGRTKCIYPSCPCHEASQVYMDALHESIRCMIYKVASTFRGDCRDETDELAQRCFQRIWSKLDYFDPSKSKFSTWAWKVSLNILRGERTKTNRYKGIFRGYEEFHEKVIGCDHQRNLHGDITLSILSFRKKFPQWKQLTDFMFGCDSTKTPSTFCVAKISRETGRSYHEVRAFLVRDFSSHFKELFNYRGDQS